MTAPVPQAAVDAAQRVLGVALARYGDDADPFEWHACDECPNAPTNPCACSGQPWVEESFAREVAAAVVAAVQGPLKAEALRGAADDADPWEELHHAASWLMDRADRIEAP